MIALLAPIAAGNPFSALAQIAVDFAAAALAAAGTVVPIVGSAAWVWALIKDLISGPTVAKIKKTAWGFAISLMVAGAAPFLGLFLYDLGQQIGQSLTASDPGSVKLPTALQPNPVGTTPPTTAPAEIAAGGGQ